MAHSTSSDSNSLKPSTYDQGYWISEINQTQLNNRAPTQNSGKWLIFKSYDEIDETWEIISKATKEGRLAHASKVSTRMPTGFGDGKQAVICIYTYDWTDEEDVMRVRQELRELGFSQKLPYKSDSDTIAGKYATKGHGKVSKYYC